MNILTDKLYNKKCIHFRVNNDVDYFLFTVILKFGFIEECLLCHLICCGVLSSYMMKKYFRFFFFFHKYRFIAKNLLMTFR